MSEKPRLSITGELQARHLFILVGIGMSMALLFVLSKAMLINQPASFIIYFEGLRAAALAPLILLLYLSWKRKGFFLWLGIISSVAFAVIGSFFYSFFLVPAGIIAEIMAYRFDTEKMLPLAVVYSFFRTLAAVGLFFPYLAFPDYLAKTAERFKLAEETLKELEAVYSVPNVILYLVFVLLLSFGASLLCSIIHKRFFKQSEEQG